MNILIVDGSLEIIRRLEEMIIETNSASSIFSCISYEKALILFRDKTPDIVLLCANLSENKSLKLVTEIKALGYKGFIVILFGNFNEYLANQYKVLKVDYLLDKYRDFELIPLVVKGVSEKIRASN